MEDNQPERPLWELAYIAEPTPAVAHASDAFFRGIRGPVGSGKTVWACWEIFRNAAEQKPRRYRGAWTRFTRWALVRNTYPMLKTTTLKTWNEFFGDWCHVKEQPPMNGTLYERWQDGTYIHLEVWFLALDKPDDLGKLKSYELTGIFFNEASEMELEVINKGVERVGRFPSKRHGGPTRACILADTNSCSDDHWWYRMSEENTPDNWRFFDQPAALLQFEDEGGMLDYLGKNPGYPVEWSALKRQDLFGNWYLPNPAAENVRHQPKGWMYWLDQITSKPLREINVFILNEYGPTDDGKPVHPLYQDRVHCADDDLDYVENIGLGMGFDFGLTPAVTFSQIMPNGQKRFIDELLVKEHGAMGIQQFSRQVVVPYMLENLLPWLKAGLVSGTGDPSGSIRGQTDMTTCFQTLNECVTMGGGPVTPERLARNRSKLSEDRHVEWLKDRAKRGLVSLGDLGIKVRPSRTNSFVARKKALDDYLEKRIDGNPALLLSPRCRNLRKGLRGGYKYTRMQVSGSARYREEPDKGPLSHICEAAQYDCLESGFSSVDPIEEERKVEAERKRAALTGASAVAWAELDALRAELEQEDIHWEAV